MLNTQPVYCKDPDQLTYDKPTEDAGHFYNGKDVDAFVTEIQNNIASLNGQHREIVGQKINLEEKLRDLKAERFDIDYMRNVLGLVSGSTITFAAVHLLGMDAIWIVLTIAIFGGVISLVRTRRW